MTLNKLKDNIVKTITLGFLLLLVGLYITNIQNIPYVRVDEGWVSQAPYMLATTGTFASPMFRGMPGSERRSHVHLPFYYLFVALGFKVLGFGLGAGRLVSLLFALGISWLMFLTAKVLLPDKKTAWILPLSLLLTTPYFFVISRTIRPDIAVTFFVLASYWFLLCHSRESGNPGVEGVVNSKKKDSYLLLAGLFAGCAVISHLPGFFIFVYGSILLFHFARQKLWLFWLGFFVPLAGYGLWVITDWAAFYGQKLLYSTDITSQGGLEKCWAFFQDPKKVGLYFGVLALTLGGGWLKRRDLFKAEFFWFYLLPLGIFIVQLPFLPHTNPIYINYILPFIYLTIAYFMLHMDRALWLKGIVIGVLAINLLGLGMYWKRYTGYNYTDYIQRIQQHIPVGSTLLGQVSLYMGFYDPGQYGFYPYQNAYLIEPSLDYQTFKRRVKELGIHYLVYDVHADRSYEKIGYLKMFINSDCFLTAEFTEPFYGSEGESKNNVIKIYEVKR